MLEGLKALIGIGIAGLIIVIALCLFLLAFWFWMLMEAGKAKEWGWFVGMLITWLLGVGGILMAILYYFIEYRPKQKEAKDGRSNNARKKDKIPTNGKR